MIRKSIPKLVWHKGRANLRFYESGPGIPGGKRRKMVSLGTDSPTYAKVRAKKIVAKYLNDEVDPFKDEDLLGGVVTARKAVDRFLGEIEVRKVTIEKYSSVLELMLKELPSGCPVNLVSADDLQKVIRRCQSDEGRRAYFRTLRRFWRWAKAEGLSECVTDEIRMPKREMEVAPVFLSRGEFEEMIEACRTDQDRNLIRFLVGSGLRRREVANLKFGDVNLVEKWIEVGYRGRTTKNRKPRMVPLFEMAEDAVRSQMDRYPGRTVPASAYVFESPRGGGYGESWYSHRVGDLVKAAGLNEAIHLHTLRHTFASWLRLEGTPLEDIRDFMGHRSIATTLIYAHITPRAARERSLGIFPSI